MEDWRVTPVRSKYLALLYLVAFLLSFFIGFTEAHGPDDYNASAYSLMENK